MPRTHEDASSGEQNASELKLAQSVFEQYKFHDEYFSTHVFHFTKHHSGELPQSNHERFTRDVVHKMLQNSRANDAAVVPMLPHERAVLTHADTIFQEGFVGVFGVLPPVSILDVSHISAGDSSCADRIRRKTYIARRDFDNQYYFLYLACHEALHLCFTGFNQVIIEEGLIEMILQDMNDLLPDDPLYMPYSSERVYLQYRDSLQRFFDFTPSLKTVLYRYVIDSDEQLLRRGVGLALGKGSRKRIGVHRRGADTMMLTAFDRLIAGEEE